MVGTRSSPDRTILIVVGALYAAQGVSFGLVTEALPTLLRAGGMSLETVALVPLTMLPWMIKFLWAPLVDNRGGSRWGRRRGWILPTQAVLVAALLGVAVLPFDGTGAPLLLGLLLLGCLAACTQDIATDGLAAERLGRPKMALANTLQVGGMMAGVLVGGAGMMILSDVLGASVALMVMAGGIALTMLPVLSWREPPPDPAVSRPTARLRTFFRSRSGWALGAIALLFANGHAASGALSRLLLVDHDWPLARIGAVVGTGNSLAVILGTVLAGPLLRRTGAVGASLGGVLLTMTGPALWLAGLLAFPDLPTGLVILATLGGGVGQGVASVAVFTLAFRFAHDGAQAGTDMTMVQCLHGLGGMGMTSLATALVAQGGYAWGFAVALAAAGLTLAVVIATRRVCEPERFRANAARLPLKQGSCP
ncbi:MFS transporter [Pararhodospirillum oryzae]|uniref:MFS transporter n=1 Tax=Pararhodospirillum oryzae TaxID=478448 RepID=A0A512HC07_9PROT|nr:MFS transporter [Pararhodospirillum oryzae]GEO82987.1 MFS transporter [Pararhodospirillum oryzae]